MGCLLTSTVFVLVVVVSDVTVVWTVDGLILEHLHFASTAAASATRLAFAVADVVVVGAGHPGVKVLDSVSIDAREACVSDVNSRGGGGGGGDGGSEDLLRLGCGAAGCVSESVRGGCGS